MAVSFLCLLLILGLQGCGQKKDANSSEKISDVATTNKPTESSNNPSDDKLGKTYEIKDPKSGMVLTRHFNSLPTESEIEKEFSEYYFKTFSETKAKAEAGDTEAQFTLGSYYQIGVGVATNEVEGKKWYRKAAEQYRKVAEQGDAIAQTGFGLCYENGDGVSKDMVEAVKW